MAVDNSYKTLRGFDNTQDVLVSNILLENFVHFYDWGLVDKGDYYNIDIPEEGLYGGDKHKLRPVTDPNYTDGQVWEAYRSNWVWETGVAFSEQPTRISGVFVDTSTFRATGNIEQPYYINYPDGRVVFDTAIATTSTVHLAYAHKRVNVIPAEGVPWFREIQQGSFRLDNPTFLQTGSGDWAQLGQTRIQLPTIAIETVPAKTMSPAQLGGGQWSNNDILFYVVAEEHWECANLVDQISLQNDRTLWLFDPNRIAKSGVFPFNYRGEINENALPSGLYSHLVDDHRFARVFIHNTSAQGITEVSPELYIGTIRCSTEVRVI